jgi:NTE family protein
MPKSRPATGSRSRRAVVAAVPLFQALSGEELDRLCGELDELQLAKGEVLCREGEPGDTLFIVAGGELEVRIAAEPSRVVQRMFPGEVVGEIAMLIGGGRSATVIAARPSRLLALTKERFQALFGQNASVLAQVSRILAQRLATASGRAKAARLTLAVFAREGVMGKSLVAASLAALLHAFSGRSVVLIRLVRDAGADRRVASVSALATEPDDRLRARAEPESAGFHHLDAALPAHMSGRTLASALDEIAGKLQATFEIVVFDLCADERITLQCAAEIANVVVEISDRPHKTASARLPESVRHFLVVNRYHGDVPSIPIHHCEPFVIRPDVELLDRDPFAQAQRIVDFPRDPAAPALRRLARKILGSSVGIALGGGAAFGIAHVGVFQVLEASGIEVDLVAGTSMGSIVAIGYAAGIMPDEMHAIARRIGNVRTTLSALDFTLTRPGLLAGNRIVEIFAPLLGSVQSFEGLTYPCRIVAADIESGERVCIDSGSLADAFRASCSVPMLWSPVRSGERTLVDGAMVDPVPADVVHEMGADICIAVNAVPALKKGVKTVLSRWYRQLNSLNPLSYFGASRELPSTFDTVMNAIQTLQHELGTFKAISADVRINPDLADFTWIEFYRPLEIIERGARATEEALPSIRAVLEQRLQR